VPNFYSSIRFLLLVGGVLFLVAASGSAGTTWDGGGANASWGTANNWNPDGLPLFNGTETITIGTAFTSGTTLTLDGTRNISSLLINTNNVVGSRSEKEPECAME
jgi:hypothetical protein